VVFAVVELAALVMYLVLARDRWFLYDEWDFLSAREVGSVDDLFRPHNVHWSTLPIIVYRALWALFGLRTYLPYQILTIVTHLIVAALLLVVMRRAGANPWIATAAASLFALLGAGNESIVWAFGVTFVASLALGLVHLLLADHDGPLDRRDALGLAAGAAGLMCSGLGVTMVVVVGLSALIRRGWRIAAAHVVPLAGIYLLWWGTGGNENFGGYGAGSIGEKISFVFTGIWAVFDALGQLPGIGIALAVMLVVGLFVTWSPLGRMEQRRRAAAPLALLFGVLVFLSVTAARGGAAVDGIGLATSFSADSAKASRYLHFGAALALPALAVAATGVSRRWRKLTPLAIVLLLVGIPGNINDFVDDPLRDARFHRAYRRNVLLLPRLDVADDLPRELRPDIVLAPWVTLGWMRDSVADGKFPAIGSVAPVTAADATLNLALRARLQPGELQCRRLGVPARHRLAKGDSLRVQDGVLRVVYVTPANVRSHPRRVEAPAVLRALAGPLDLQLDLEDTGRVSRCSPA
jgi:hypothetical protein